jgi:hypothetical protein
MTIPGVSVMVAEGLIVAVAASVCVGVAVAVSVMAGLLVAGGCVDNSASVGASVGITISDWQETNVSNTNSVIINLNRVIPEYYGEYCNLY